MKEKRDIEKEVVKRQIILYKNGRGEINIILLLRFDFFKYRHLYTHSYIRVHMSRQIYIQSMLFFTNWNSHSV